MLKMRIDEKSHGGAGWALLERDDRDLSRIQPQAISLGIHCLKRHGKVSLTIGNPSHIKRFSLTTP